MSGLSMPSVPAAGDQANSEYDWLQRQLQLGQDNTRINQSGPFGSQTWNGNSLQTSYDPRIEGDFYGILGSRAGQRSAYDSAMGRAGQYASQGFNPSGLPGLASGVSGNPVQTGVDTSGFMGMPGSPDAYAAQGQKVGDALYNQFASRADQRFARAHDQQDTSLRNKGFVPGSQGYTQASQDLGNQENDAYQQAALGATLASGQEQSRQMADMLRVRGQQANEGFANAGLYNSGMGQDFGQRLAGAGQQNQARSQGFGEQMSQYMLPFQIAQSLQPSQSPILPNMGSATTGLAQPKSPSYNDFTSTQYSSDLNRRNANMGWLQNGLNLAGSAIGAFPGGAAGLAGAIGKYFGGGGGGGMSGAGPNGEQFGPPSDLANGSGEFGPPSDLANGAGEFGPPSDLFSGGEQFGPPSDLFDPSQFDPSQFDMSGFDPSQFDMSSIDLGSFF